MININTFKFLSCEEDFIDQSFTEWSIQYIYGYMLNICKILPSGLLYMNFSDAIFNEKLKGYNFTIVQENIQCEYMFIVSDMDKLSNEDINKKLKDIISHVKINGRVIIMSLYPSKCLEIFENFVGKKCKDVSVRLTGGNAKKYSTSIENVFVCDFSVIEDQVINVVGYQHYEYKNMDLIPTDTSTIGKYNIYKNYCISKDKTVSDLGCAEGFNGFKCAINDAKHVYLVDHFGKDIVHKNNIAIVEKIKSLIGSNITIVNTEISEFHTKCDIVLAFAIIHWIYSFSDVFGSLEKIIEYLSDITYESLFVEWISPEDGTMKARNILGDNPGVTVKNDYNKETFLRVLNRNFKEVKLIGVMPNCPIRETYMANKFFTKFTDDLANYKLIVCGIGCGTSNIYLSQDFTTIIKIYLRFKEDVYDKFYKCIIKSHYKTEKQSLIRLYNSGICPKLISYDDEKYTLKMEYCGDVLCKGNLPSDWKDQLKTIIRVLKEYSIWHNDSIRIQNYVVKNGKIYIIDFGWATFTDVKRKTITNELIDMYNENELEKIFYDIP